MAGGPLEGVRIVDLTSVVVGPLCTQILADHGADVIKVESRAGDLVRVMNGKSVTPGMGAKFLHLNRNKRSIVLDLKTPQGYAALMRLLERADVMIWNNRPHSMARMKLAYADVRERRWPLEIRVHLNRHQGDLVRVEDDLPLTAAAPALAEEDRAAVGLVHEGARVVGAVAALHREAQPLPAGHVA